MRNNKVIKGIVLGSTVLSMLIGHSDVIVSAETKYDNEIDLYDETNEVISFDYKFATKHMRDTQWHIRSDKAFWGDKGVSYAMSSDGYYFVSKGIVAMSSPIAIYDNTNSVKKITVDGKKSYKLDNPKVSKNDFDTYYDFGDNSLHDLGVKIKKSSKLKYSTLSEGKHTLVVKDKHGHKVTMKLWKDTKAPKVKVIKKGNKYIGKITDKGSGIGKIELNGKETTYTKRKTSVTLTFSKKKYFKIKSFSVEDRSGNCY